MADEEEDLGFLVGFDLAGVKRAMGWDVGREERRERCGFSRLGLYQCRPRRRGAAERRGREGEREERRGDTRQLARRTRSGVMGWAIKELHGLRHNGLSPLFLPQ
jgi:hypothetical protein